MEKNASDILVIYSVTAAIKCGAAAADHGITIDDSVTSEYWLELVSTFAANAYDTLHITFPEGLPLYLQTTAGSGAFRNTVTKATTPQLRSLSSALPAGGYITVTFDYVPQSAIR